MIGLHQRLSKIDATREYKPVRASSWVQECRDLMADFATNSPAENVAHIDHVCGEIVRASGFKALREDVWRYLRFEQARAAR